MDVKSSLEQCPADSLAERMAMKDKVQKQCQVLVCAKNQGKNTLQSRAKARFQLECLQAVARKRIRTDRGDHYDEIARLGAACAAGGDGRGLWRSFKPKSLVGVKLEDGSLARDEQNALQRWVRYFQKLYTAVVTQDPPSVTHDLEVRPSMHHVPSCHTILEVLMQLPHGKSAGPDGLPVEVWRAGGPPLMNRLVTLVQRMFYEKKTFSCLERRSVGANMERL